MGEFSAIMGSTGKKTWLADRVGIDPCAWAARRRSASSSRSCSISSSFHRFFHPFDRLFEPLPGAGEVESDESRAVEIPAVAQSHAGSFEETVGIVRGQGACVDPGQIGGLDRIHGQSGHA